MGLSSMILPLQINSQRPKDHSRSEFPLSYYLTMRVKSHNGKPTGVNHIQTMALLLPGMCFCPLLSLSHLPVIQKSLPHPSGRVGCSFPDHPTFHKSCSQMLVCVSHDLEDSLNPRSMGFSPGFLIKGLGQSQSACTSNRLQSDSSAFGLG
jgi:hypothetical protein